LARAEHVSNLNIQFQNQNITLFMSWRNIFSL